MFQHTLQSLTFTLSWITNTSVSVKTSHFPCAFICVYFNTRPLCLFGKKPSTVISIFVISSKLLYPWIFWFLFWNIFLTILMLFWYKVTHNHVSKYLSGLYILLGLVWKLYNKWWYNWGVWDIFVEKNDTRIPRMVYE